MRWRRKPPPAPHPADEVDEQMLERAHAEDRLRTVEQRAEGARRVILARHARNHWTEALRSTIHGGTS